MNVGTKPSVKYDLCQDNQFDVINDNFQDSFDADIANDYDYDGLRLPQTVSCL